MMKVIQYIPSIDEKSGGVGAYLKLLAHSLGKMVDLHIVTHHSNNELSIENCTLYYIDNDLARLKKTRQQFLNILDRIKPDIVHVNSCWEPLCSFTVFWSKSKDYPVVITPHGMLEPWVIKRHYWTKKLPALLLYQRRSLKKADALIATSDAERLNLLRHGYNPAVMVVPNGIIVDNISMKQTWEKRHTILYLGLLRPNKGAGILLDSAAKIKDKLKGYKIIIAGPDTEGYLNTLMQKSEELGLQDIVEFPGGVWGEAKWELYKEADFFVLPTLNENFGIVIAESYLAGTPVITCKGAPWSAISEEKIGWWVERTADEIAKAMMQAINCTPDQLEEMGKRGCKYVKEHFSSDRIAKKMIETYNKVMSPPRVVSHQQVKADYSFIDCFFIALPFNERRAA